MNFAFITRSLPVIIWSFALIAVGFLFVDQSHSVRLKGIAFGNEQVINSVETGYIASLPVQLYQEIKQGETLAVIKENTASKDEFVKEVLSATKATAEAELAMLRAELTAAEEKLSLEEAARQNDRFQTERTLSVDVENARLNILEIKSNLEPDKLALKDIEVEIEIVKKLLEQDAAEEYELQKIEANYAILSEKVNQQIEVLKHAENLYEQAMIRKNEFEHKYPLRPRLADKELDPIRKAIVVQERKIEELMTQRDLIVLKAPFDGYITSLDYKRGQTVVRGEPIMTLVKPSPETITAWVSQKSMKDFDLHSEVEVLSLGNPSQIFKSHISNISASLEQIPQRLWGDPTIPEWGRAIQIPIQPDFACLHNEVVGVRLLQ